MTDRELDVLTRTVYGEASSESNEGIAAVVHVIANRLKGNYGKDIIEICLKPLQFSCWNTNDPNRLRIMRANLETPNFFRVHAICSGVFAGIIPNPIGEANHYFADYITPPSWAKQMTFIRQIGHHLFYKA